LSKKTRQGLAPFRVLQLAGIDREQAHRFEQEFCPQLPALRRIVDDGWRDGRRFQADEPPDFAPGIFERPMPPLAQGELGLPQILRSSDRQILRSSDHPAGNPSSCLLRSSSVALQSEAQAG